MFGPEDLSYENSGLGDVDIVASVLFSLLMVFEEWKKHQREDDELQPIIERISKGEESFPYVLKYEILCYPSRSGKKLKVVPLQTLIPLVFKFYIETAFDAHRVSLKLVRK